MLEQVIVMEEKENCCLCGKLENNMTYYSNWNQEQQSFIEKHLGQAPTGNRICKQHHLEASHHSDSSYVPKWKRTTVKSQVITQSEVKSCMYPNCTSTSDKCIVATFASPSELMAVTGILKDENSDISLCKTHYNKVYKTINPTECSFCHAYPKTGKTFNRLS